MKQAPWHLYIDGASRNNPGLSGAGIVLINNGQTVLKQGHFLGVKTNNQAEYFALLLGLFYAHKYVQLHEHLAIFADSELLVRQMNGAYKVKNTELQQLQKIAFKLAMPFEYTISHVLRHQNELADEMANEGIDNNVPLPQLFLTMLKEHEVSK